MTTLAGDGRRIGRLATMSSVYISSLVPNFRKTRHEGLVLREFQIHRAESARFNQFVGFPDESVSPVLPMMSAARLVGMALLDRRREVPSRVLVHTASKIVQHEPVVPGQLYTLRCDALKLKEVTNGVVVSAATELMTDEQCIWSGSFELLSRKRGSRTVTRQPYPPEGDFNTRRVSWHLAEGLGRAYARLSGDYNPIHLHALLARLFGFRRPIAHGVWLLGRIAAELSNEVGFPKNIQAQFLRPVTLPGSYEFMTSKQDKQGARQFTLVDSQRQRPHIQGSARSTSANAS